MWSKRSFSILSELEIFGQLFILDLEILQFPFCSLQPKHACATSFPILGSCTFPQPFSSTSPCWGDSVWTSQIVNTLVF